MLLSQIGFYHSACGGNWTETHRSGHHLRMEEELCCRFEKGKSAFFRCDGSDYRRVCPKKEELEDQENETDNGLGKFETANM